MLSIKKVPKYINNEVIDFIETSSALMMFANIGNNYYVIDRKGKARKLRELPMHSLILLYKRLVRAKNKSFKFSRSCTPVDITGVLRRAIGKRKGCLPYFRAYFPPTYMISQAVYMFNSKRKERLEKYLKEVKQ